MSVHFKLVSTDTELERIESLAITIWREHYIPIIGKPQVEYMLKKYQSVAAMKSQIEHEAYSYYQICDNTLIGYFSVQSRSPFLFLSKLYIKSDKRNLGYASQSLNFITLLAEDKGLKGIELTVNKFNSGSIAFYEKLGFKKVKDIVIDIGEGYIMDDYLMQKSFD